jgi:D-glycero-D-manno-heptose 1,7-bisphosphate phosphatase
MISNRAVFLDRDGVINAMVYNADFGLVDSPANPDEFQLLPGVAAAVRDLNRMDFKVVVASNQPGIAKGKFSLALLQAMTDKMLAGLAEGGARLDAVYYCYHHPEGVAPEYRQVCDCRKPKPGLLLKAAADLEIDLSRSFFIGDGITDVLAGKAAGVETLLLYASSPVYLVEELARQNVQPDHIVKSLAEAVAIVSRVANPATAEGLP